MGTITHHVIVITSHSQEAINRAYRKFNFMDFVQVSAPSVSFVNAYWTMIIFPDGSKNDWPASDSGDASRSAIVEWLKCQRNEDGSSPYEWFEAEYGADMDGARITRHEWEGQDSETKRG